VWGVMKVVGRTGGVGFKSEPNLRAKDLQAIALYARGERIIPLIGIVGNLASIGINLKPTITYK
jgi:hypothetical protein